MPDTCIHDRDEECFHSCKECTKYISQCDDCGSQENLYDFGTVTLCFDHIKEKYATEHYENFIKDNSEMFDEYMKEIYKENELCE